VRLFSRNFRQAAGAKLLSRERDQGRRRGVAQDALSRPIASRLRVLHDHSANPLGELATCLRLEYQASWRAPPISCVRLRRSPTILACENFFPRAPTPVVSNDYYASDVAWMQAGDACEAAIGP